MAHGSWRLPTRHLPLHTRPHALGDPSRSRELEAGLPRRECEREWAFEARLAAADDDEEDDDAAAAAVGVPDDSVAGMEEADEEAEEAGGASCNQDWISGSAVEEDGEGAGGAGCG